MLKKRVRKVLEKFALLRDHEKEHIEWLCMMYEIFDHNNAKVFKIYIKKFRLTIKECLIWYYQSHEKISKKR